MTFTFPKINLPSKITIKKPDINLGILQKTVGGLLLENAYKNNPDAFKKNISSIHSTIKTDIGDTFKGGSKILGGVFDKLMFPLIAIGTIVVLVVIFKK